MVKPVSEWRGFDPRKICPRCGEYQTRVMRSHSPAGGPALPAAGVILSVTLVMLAAAAVLMALGRMSAVSWWLYVLILLPAVGLPLTRILSWRNTGQAVGESGMGQPPPAGYHLTCHRCGHTWRMTAAEWESAGKVELADIPAPPPAGTDAADPLADLRRSTAPESRRPAGGAVLLAGTALLAVAASLLLLGVLWAKSHPGDPRAVSFYLIATVLGGLTVIGAARFFKRGMVKVLPLVLILLAAVLVYFTLK